MSRRGEDGEKLINAIDSEIKRVKTLLVSMVAGLVLGFIAYASLALTGVGEALCLLDAIVMIASYSAIVVVAKRRGMRDWRDYVVRTMIVFLPAWLLGTVASYLVLL